MNDFYGLAIEVIKDAGRSDPERFPLFAEWYGQQPEPQPQTTQPAQPAA